MRLAGSDSRMLLDGEVMVEGPVQAMVIDLLDWETVK